MKKQLLFLMILPLAAAAQPLVSSWKMNNNGQKASYTMSNGSYVNTTDSADIIKVCYRTDSVWVYCHGMTFNMGKYHNPGGCTSQVYIHRFPATPVVAVNKVTSPKIGAIGLLTNGVPIYGLGDSKSWNGSSNVSNGPGIWNVEVYLSEGFTLDTAFSAHPQQAGAYHSHANPIRLYKNVPTSQHSPLIGYAFDGYPVYGPYGYSNPTDASSAIARMKSGYALRNITTRTTLPDGSTASQTGPNVSATYPLGTYCEDYAWSASNGGDLDEYNGRFCITPEYPAGTYAYFTTIDASLTPQFPYYIGIEYYGAPDEDNFTLPGGTSTAVQMPSTGVNCIYAITGIEDVKAELSPAVYPNPSNGTFTVQINEDLFPKATLEIVNVLGQAIYSADVSTRKVNVALPEGTAKGMYFVRLSGKYITGSAIQKIVIE